MNFVKGGDSETSNANVAFIIQLIVPSQRSRFVESRVNYKNDFPLFDI